jgi:glycosyltransferase involved in cell wall biosynthesis
VGIDLKTKLKNIQLKNNKLKNNKLKNNKLKNNQVKNTIFNNQNKLSVIKTTSSKLRDFSKLSIITVSFNADKTIESTIKSVLSQSNKNFEYIIKDGNSKDNTLKIVSKYVNNFFKGKKIDELIFSNDAGLYDAMNIAVKKARGEYICFLNADDVFKDNKVVSKVMPFLDGKNDLVFGDVEFFYPLEKNTVRISRNASIADLRMGDMPPHQGAFVKRELLIKYPFNTKFKSSADFDFFCNILTAGALTKKINSIIATVRIGGISSKNISYEETAQIVKNNFGLSAFLLIKLKHKSFNFFKNSFQNFGILNKYHSFMSKK